MNANQRVQDWIDRLQKDGTRQNVTTFQEKPSNTKSKNLWIDQASGSTTPAQQQPNLTTMQAQNTSGIDSHLKTSQLKSSQQRASNLKTTSQTRVNQISHTRSKRQGNNLIENLQYGATEWNKQAEHHKFRDRHRAQEVSKTEFIPSKTTHNKFNAHDGVFESK